MAQARLSLRDLHFLSRRARLVIALPALGLLAGAFWIAIQFLHPLPPQRVVLAAGPEGSTLHRAGEHYREILARDGIHLEVRTTQGTGENLRLLDDTTSGVDVGFVLAGTAPAPVRSIVNISNLAHVALWALARRDDAVDTLLAMRGKRISTGLPASGLGLAMASLLAANGVSAENTRILHLGDAEALAKFASGELDVVFTADGPRSPAFVEAAARPGVELVSFVRADAYARRFPHLTRLELPMGSLDFVHNIPPRTTTLIGTTLLLAAREDLHPTVIDVLVDAARQSRTLGGHFDRQGEFPHLDAVDAIPVSAQAILHARSGPNLLRRYLPLWLADFLQRLFTLSIPVIAVALPLVRIVPGVVDHVLSGRLDRCYLRLRRLEAEAESGGRVAEAIVRDLDELADGVRRMQLPLSYASAVFALRSHVAHVRQRLAGAPGR